MQPRTRWRRGRRTFSVEFKKRRREVAQGESGRESARGTGIATASVARGKAYFIGSIVLRGDSA